MRFSEATEVMGTHELPGFGLLTVLLLCVLGKKGLGVPGASREVPVIWDMIVTSVAIEIALVLNMIIPIHIIGISQDAMAGHRTRIWQRL